ncbi:hypothetical protein AVEN_26678-1 [Araneus ventricosus]|uniref:Uncharacterized protein n=1 Tax=Araneus ventricosus TaxID=182803 RepID=A0A4Y2NUZ6_ARAVE|nr:hypothetical protein AVEN_26678-1 [Araneus ventricosus]
MDHAILKKVETGSFPKCFKKARFGSASDVVPDSATDENEKELNELLIHMDSNVRVEDYVEIDKDLWIEEEVLNVTISFLRTQPNNLFFPTMISL